MKRTTYRKLYRFWKQESKYFEVLRSAYYSQQGFMEYIPIDTHAN